MEWLSTVRPWRCCLSKSNRWTNAVSKRNIEDTFKTLKYVHAFQGSCSKILNLNIYAFQLKWKRFNDKHTNGSSFVLFDSGQCNKTLCESSPVKFPSPPWPQLANPSMQYCPLGRGSHVRKIEKYTTRPSRVNLQLRERTIWEVLLCNRLLV